MAAQPQQATVHQLYKRLETVGKGAYGSVHKGIEIASGNIVALKIINLDTADDDVADIQREVALLTHLRDAVNITRYYGCFLDGPRVWIVMEYAQGGSVRTLMKACKNNILQERHIVIVTRELLLALASLHKAGVIHRDIKAANILITATGKVMLCDFGVSALLVTAHSKRNTLVGTPYWMAPEVAQPVPNYDTKADIWSLGITIYEMVTGSPPHSNLDGLKVVQLIPRSKPPRLTENEGSRELREFTVSCLRESSAERPSADELSRSKWIKATAKTPVSVLKDLLVQYEAWQQAGGVRASIADPLPWEDEEEERMQTHSSGNEEENWEFDTVRARSIIEADAPLDDLDVHRSPQVSARVPTSLRGLFGDNSSTMASNNSLGVPNAWSRSNTPTPPLGTSSPVQTQAGSSRGRPAPRRGTTITATTPSNDPATDDTARQASFVFPSRPATTLRTKSKLSTSVPSSDNESGPSNSPERTARLLPLGAGSSSGFGHGRGIGDATMNSGTPHAKMPSQDEGSQSKESTMRPSPGYREVRTSRGVPNISIPPANIHSDMGSSVDASTSALISATDEKPVPLDSPSRTHPIFARKRSQSSAASSTPSSSSPIRHRNPAFPSDFHFPPVSAAASFAGPVLPLPVLPPSRASNSSGSDTGRSPAAHHSAYSLDAYRDPSSAGLGQGVSGGGLGIPPSISRVHSSNTFSESTAPSGHAPPQRMSITRQASVAVMETVVRSPGPGVSIERVQDSAPVPGLKDVLKIPSLTSEMRLGMTDLLPPSPSAASANRRFFSPTPSSLSSSITPTEPNSTGGSQASPSLVQTMTTRTAPSSPSIPPSVPSVGTTKHDRQPSPAERQATDVSVSTSSSSTTYASISQLTHSISHSHNVSSASSFASATGLGTGPSLPPLDFSPLLSSHEETHAALARTVNDLVQWLGVVNSGLSAVLERTAPAGASAASATNEAFLNHVQDDEGYLDDTSRLDEDPALSKDELEFFEDRDAYADDDVEGEEDGAVGTFEQFLANVHRRPKDHSEDDWSSEDGGGPAAFPLDSNTPSQFHHEQLTAYVS